MCINAQSARPEQPKLYKWPGTGQLVTWPALLRLWGSEVASRQSGEAGTYICDQLLGLADLAESWRVDGPAEMTARKQAEAEQEAAYLAALEHDANANWDPGEPEDQYDTTAPDIFGSLIGPDETAIQAWLSQDPDDETRLN
jgi:hypothetical protein